MKKLLAMVLALVMTLSLAVSANAAFKDAESVDDTFAEAVEVLNGMKVFKGYEDGSFKPQGDITRAEVAAIVYRIYTSDVKDTYVKNYETYNKFSDMAGAGWAKGYIGYCANAALVKGYPDGTFAPSGKVTGYEVLAMILRAVGYDQNNEFTGADWALHVAQIAEQAGILGNVKGVDLNKAATRELVAELLFQAIQVPMVTYTAAFGYQNVSLGGDKLIKDNVSLGSKNFNLKSEESNDVWGRPTKVWLNSKSGSKYATIAIEPDAAFQVETSECDICEALGEKKSAEIVETYVNGVLTKDTDKYTATATKSMKGDQGQQIEYYNVDTSKYRMVVIDTYLAEVTKVVEEKTDAKGHITTDAYLKLDAYTTAADKNGVVEPETLYVKGNDYAKGDYILINVNRNSKNDVTITSLSGKQTLVEVVAKAESFDGAQSKIWYNSSKRTVEDKDYMSAAEFNLDQAGNSKGKFTWFLDQFGNVIGSVEIETKYSYAVLKELNWVVGRPGHAEATLVYMNGEEDTVTVASIDGYNFSANNPYADNDNATPELTDNNGACDFINKIAKVSSDSKYNGVYEGYALYRVSMNSDDEAVLDLYDGDALVYYVEDADFSANKVYADADGFWGYVSDETEFLVRETKDNGDVVYTTYTRDSLPKYAQSSVKAWFTVDKDNYLTRVYIQAAKDAADFDDHLFVTTKSYYRVAGEYNTFKMTVVVNGVEKEILTNEENAKYLAANEGKLFHVTYEEASLEGYYGFVKDLYLVNNSEENDCTDGDTWCEYFVKPVLKGSTLTEQLSGDEHGYRIDANTKFVGVENVTELEQAIDDGKGVWVVAEYSNNYDLALIVYVGEKLDESVALTVTAKDGTITVDKDDPTKIAFTSVIDATSDKLTFTANDANSVLLYDNNGVALYTATVDTAKPDSKWTVTVWNEAGTESEEYTVSLAWPVHANEITITIGDVTMDAQTGCEVNFTLADKDNAVTFTTDMVEVKLVNEKGQDVYTTADISNTDNNFTATIANTLTANASYKVVITVNAGSGLTATAQSAYIEAQTTTVQ